MRKSLIIIMIVTFMLSITGSGYAANPFVDVPANHWAYNSVMELAKAGLVDGMSDGTFQGGKSMTRYEMAQMIAKAMTKADKADMKIKTSILKLQAEFAAELQTLGVKVDGLKTKIDNMPKLSGEIRSRYQDGTVKDDERANGLYSKLRSRIFLSGNINDNWTYGARFENNQNLRSENVEYDADDVSYINDNFSHTLAWVEGKIGTTKVQLGRFAYSPVYGLVNDASLKGISVKGGKDLNYAIYYGHSDGNMWLTENEIIISNMERSSTVGAEVGAKLGDKLNLKAGYSRNEFDAGNKINFWELGGDYQINPDWNMKAVYAKSNADYNNKAYLVGFKYKGMDVQKPGSFGVDLSYQRSEEDSVYNSTLDVDPGFKGYKLGLGYTIDKNIQIVGTYIDEKLVPVPQFLDISRKIIRTELFFYF